MFGGGMPGRPCCGTAPGGSNPGGGIPGGGTAGGGTGGIACPGTGILPGGMPGRGGPPGGIPGRAGARIGGAWTLGLGSIIPGVGPPTPLAGPPSPPGGCPGAATGSPRPAARPTPVPAGATCVLSGLLSSAGGGPSIINDITSSPRSSTNPSTLLSSLSSFPFFGGSFLNSSASPSTKFMCRSNAINLPTIWRPSRIVTLIR